MLNWTEITRYLAGRRATETAVIDWARRALALMPDPYGAIHANVRSDARDRAKEVFTLRFASAVPTSHRDLARRYGVSPQRSAQLTQLAFDAWWQAVRAAYVATL